MKTNIKSLSTRTVTFLMAVLIFVGSFSAYSFVFADRFDEQIKQLSAENAQKQGQVQALQVEADSLQGVIAAMQAQIDGLQKQIADNTAKSEALKLKIAEAEAELAKQRNLLGQNIKAMYLEGDISTLEMLASSKDLSDFVDKQQYRSSVKDKIKDTLDKITALKLQLNAQKEEIERLLKEQTALSQQIAAQQAEQNRLLNMNQSEQAAYNQQIKDNKTKISDLKRQQVLENIKLFGGGTQPGIPGGGNYPWGNAYCVHTGQIGGACYNYDWYFNGRAWDPWSYGFRNCTSWVAYKLAADGKTGITGLGNAAQWPGNAAARGFQVSYGSGAREGDAAVNPNGYYGHVMYVEAVNGNQVIVSDYNRLGDGLYRGPEGGSAAVINQSSLVFIHF
jgi:peptidoglycan DL-endopeptidase CwlO